MFKSLCFYSQLTLPDLEKNLQLHQEGFDELLGDTFTEEELEQFAPLLDQVSFPHVQNLSSELKFDDFEFLSELEPIQRPYFKLCKTSLVLENLADFHFNPFQVTYVRELLRFLDECLIDRGGVYPLVFKSPFLDSMKSFKNIFSLVKDLPKVPLSISQNLNSPMDLILRDVYAEMERLMQKNSKIDSGTWPEKVTNLYKHLSRKDHNSESLLFSSKLSPKDFGDNLERLKFILKKIT